MGYLEDKLVLLLYAGVTGSGPYSGVYGMENKCITAVLRWLWFSVVFIDYYILKW